MGTVLISASALIGQMDELARKAGIHEYVRKTQDMAEAVEAITRLLEKRPMELSN